MNRHELHAAFDRLLDAIAAEASAKDDKALSNADRFAKQQEVIGIMHEVQRDSGLLDLLQRRLVVEVRGAANGTPMPPSALPAKAGAYEGEAGERLLRAILSRVALDSGTLPKAVEGLIAGDMLFASEGYKLTGAFGDLSKPVPRSGRNADKGVDYAVRLFFVSRIGYTAGYEDRPDTRLVTRDIFERGCRALRAKRGGLVKLPAHETVRGWCFITDKDTFESARREGEADRKAGKSANPDVFLPL